MDRWPSQRREADATHFVPLSLNVGKVYSVSLILKKLRNAYNIDCWLFKGLEKQLSRIHTTDYTLKRDISFSMQTPSRCFFFTLRRLANKFLINTNSEIIVKFWNYFSSHKKNSVGKYEYR